jgi:hypothetical protein
MFSSTKRIVTADKVLHKASESSNEEEAGLESIEEDLTAIVDVASEVRTPMHLPLDVDASSLKR